MAFLCFLSLQSIEIHIYLFLPEGLLRAHHNTLITLMFGLCNMLILCLFSIYVG